MRLIQHVSPVLVGAAISTWPSIFLHELGHSTAAKLLFSDVSPKITVSWTLKGQTDLNGRADKLTKLGSFFTKKTCKGMAAAAGPLTDLINVTGSAFLLYNCHDVYPTLLEVLATHTFLRSVQMGSYAMSASKTSDYIKISKKLNISHFSLQLATVTIAVTSGLYALSIL